MKALLVGTLLLAATAAQSTKDYLVCETILGPNSVANVPTRTFALTLTSHTSTQVTTTPMTTVTAPAITNTVTTTTTVSTSTTEPTVTDTITTTTTTSITLTTTDSFTDLVTTTLTDTVTSTGTTTISTSPGFTPAISEATNAPTIVVKRQHPRANPPRYHTTVTRGRDGIPTVFPKLYPQEVLCEGLVEVIETSTSTATGATSTVTVTPPASSATSIITTTATVTIIPPDATSVTTETDTATETATVSTTITNTITTSTSVTVLLPTATFYAACDPATNQVQVIEGSPIIGFGTNNQVGQGTAPSAYDCCVACILSPTCGAAVYFGGSSDICFSVAESNGVCDPTQQVLEALTYPGDPIQDTISDGNCGAISLQS